MELKMKREKGITLIALVITIIILLILAGITIATLTGENGVLNKANTAKQETTKQGAKEKVQVEVMGSYDNNGKINLEELNNNLSKNIPELKYQGNSISVDNKIEKLPAIVVVDGYNVKIHENANVTLEGEKPTPPIQVEPEIPQKPEKTIFTFGDATNEYDGITGKCEEFIVPYNGNYKLEVWGAQGGSGGNGGYSSGILELKKEERLYIYIGGRGEEQKNIGANYLLGGFNGGGNSGIPSYYTPLGIICDAYGSGGGATDIRRIKATEGSWYDVAHKSWSEDASLLSRIIVAGGGGRNWYSRRRTDGTGEPGGGLTTTGATQSSGYQFGLGQNGANGQDAAYKAEGNGGSGGGYYGGTASTSADDVGGRGGSGYVGNLIDGISISGGEEMPNHNGTAKMIGNVGGGYAKITYIY